MELFEGSAAKRPSRRGETYAGSPVPSQIQGWQSMPKEVYANDAEYLADMAKAYRTELQILYGAGLRNVQIDDPNLACKTSSKISAPRKCSSASKTTTEDATALLDSYIALYNDCLGDRSSDFHVGVHLCRGNFVGSRHFSKGGYDTIATKLFQDLNVDTYYLEYDTPRAGGFEPLVHLPKRRNIILGLITSKFPQLEDAEEMKTKVYAAAESVAKGSGDNKEEALKRLGVSPQCGFASHSEGNALGYNRQVEASEESG